jgi:hypothetical protein
MSRTADVAGWLSVLKTLERSRNKAPARFSERTGTILSQRWMASIVVVEPPAEHKAFYDASSIVARDRGGFERIDIASCFVS